MSTWRAKGFVQDSDEDDEDIELSCSNPQDILPISKGYGGLPGVGKGIPSTSVVECTNSEKRSHQGHVDNALSTAAPSVDGLSRTRTVTPPTVALANFNRTRLTDSPDPLLGSPTPQAKHPGRFSLSSQILGIFDISPASSPPTEEKERSEKGKSPLLSELSDSELSDPPSELEEFQPDEILFRPPLRRTTVQVVIPCSNAVGNSQVQPVGQHIERSLRERKPIQLHPYLVESERYKRDLQGRGVKPVVRVLSPTRKPHRDDQESQEQEFDPDKDLAQSSAPEIAVSTPSPRRRAEGEDENSTRRKRHNPENRRAVSSISNGPKRRKLCQSSRRTSTQIHESATGNNMHNTDVWTVPQSPPYSSSSGITPRRVARASATMPFPDPPTPSNSSSLLQPFDAESDEESVLRSVRQSHVKARQPIILSDTSSSDDEPSAGETQLSEHELRQVGKKIKGVLPASWLRLDRQAQEQRKRRATDRSSSVQSPERAEYQRGVAHKIMKHKDMPTNAERSEHVHSYKITISDDSDNDAVMTASETANAQSTARAAFDTTTMSDQLIADDDSDNMENDRLHLFTLGGSNRTRRKQSKITDDFTAPMRKKHVSMRGAPDSRDDSFKLRTATRKAHRTPLPALSILDMAQSNSSKYAVPQFLRLAHRQARGRPDYARQSPTNKYIRLHTAQDTADANATLDQWRKGMMKPQTGISKTTSTSVPRKPLSILDQVYQKPHASQNVPSVSKRQPQPSTTKPQSRLPRKLLSKSAYKLSKEGCQPVHRRRNFIPLKSAQLEGLAADYGGDDRAFAFEKGLQRVARQFDLQRPLYQPSQNPQIVRYLAHADDVPLPLSQVEDVSQQAAKTLSQNTAVFKRCPRQKPQAHRVDVDTREYRQPSEPAVDSYLRTISEQTAQNSHQDDSNRSILRGLGPYGTRYSTTFDISPVQDGTYFHVSTFVGSGELHRALAIVGPNPRNMDQPAGYCTLDLTGASIRCGPWEDNIFAYLTDATTEIHNDVADPTGNETQSAVPGCFLVKITKILRSLVEYISVNLSFHDSIDRGSFVGRMEQWTATVTKSIVSRSLTSVGSSPAKPLALLLVLCTQLRSIARHVAVQPSVNVALDERIINISQKLVGHILDHVSDLSDFLEHNNRFQVRENGIRDSDPLIESLVVCMHVLPVAGTPGTAFWDFVNRFLSPTAKTSVDLVEIEAVWGKLFTLLPFNEFNDLGIPARDRRISYEKGSWNVVRTLVQRIFLLYPDTLKARNTSLNDYVRAILIRCHGLIHYWHWIRCEPVLYAMFDFFVAKNGLQHLSEERCFGSTAFLETSDDQCFSRLGPNDRSFHIFLKCLFVGIQGMRNSYTEKKLRSVVLRLIPNHGRGYPKDQPLEMANLDALRNHHDIMCTLYRASPPPCRPKLDQIKSLVNHETSHREACRISICAWANLTTFQLSTDEPYQYAQAFAEWHQEIMMQTLKQYRLAKTEAEDYLKSGVLNDSEPSSLMARQYMEKNQNQVIAALRDCIGGILKAMGVRHSQALLRDFLIDSNIVHLLELPHLQDQRFIIIIRDALRALRTFAALPWEIPNGSTTTGQNEESQDYGDPLDLDDFMEVAPEIAQPEDFLQTSLWRLLSNAFGAETAPEDGILIDCVETWCLVARSQVSQGARSWAFYLDPFSQVSWQQLRRTEQTQKFGPYFMASVLMYDPAAYVQHRTIFLGALLISLADRESMLRFQYRLLDAIIHAAPQESLLQNLPFLEGTGASSLDINANTVQTRRLGLISSILANMRDEFLRIIHETPARITEVKSTYAAMLKDFMNAMKNNYQQLGTGTTVTGTYVEFVQKVVQFLQQYTADIQPVLIFFTNSVAFPLPAADPAYVVGRLCGYAPKISRPGIAKQLSMFIQTVAQQAVTGDHQPYLVHQLQTALCKDVAPSRDRSALRDVLLLGIFPAYVRAAFGSPVGFVIAQPVLQSLESILQALLCDVKIFDKSNIQVIYDCLLAISHGFLQSVERLKENDNVFEQPHVIQALSHLFRIAIPLSTLLQYICDRCLQSTVKPLIISRFEEVALFINQLGRGITPQTDSFYDSSAILLQNRYSDLLAFSEEGLRSGIDTNWSSEGHTIYFGQGQAKRAVSFDWGVVDIEKASMAAAMDAFLLHASASDVERVNDGFLGDVYV